MLRGMQESTANSSANTHSDFAGLLAALAAAKPAAPPAWSDEELPHDVATLSYERALQAHARYRPAIDDFSVQQTSAAGVSFSSEAARHETKFSCPGDRSSESIRDFVSIREPDRKCASITIRMSKAECERLKRRAAEAGLTISAYLRSCTFEAEELRAQVKDTLAELRKVETPVGVDPHDTDARFKRRNTFKGIWLRWLRRLLPDLHHGRHLSRA
jgi:hypothetical protein